MLRWFTAALISPHTDISQLSHAPFFDLTLWSVADLSLVILLKDTLPHNCGLSLTLAYDLFPLSSPNWPLFPALTSFSPLLISTLPHGLILPFPHTNSASCFLFFPFFWLAFSFFHVSNLPMLLFNIFSIYFSLIILTSTVPLSHSFQHFTSFWVYSPWFQANRCLKWNVTNYVDSILSCA